MNLFKNNENLNTKKTFSKNSKQLNKIKPLVNSNLLLKNEKNLFNINLYEKFVNLLMKHGEKCKAYKILYEALNLLYIKHSFRFFNKLEPKIFDTKTVLYKNEKKINLSKIQTFNKNLLFKNKFDRKKLFQESIFIKTLFFKAIENIKPSLEVRSVKIRGKTYQVPSAINVKRQQILAIRWIIDAARKRKKTSNKNFAECLFLELSEALTKSGKLRQKRDMLHRQVQSNRANLRFRWW